MTRQIIGSLNSNPMMTRKLGRDYIEGIAYTLEAIDYKAPYLLTNIMFEKPFRSKKNKESPITVKDYSNRSNTVQTYLYSMVPATSSDIMDYSLSLNNINIDYLFSCMDDDGVTKVSFIQFLDEDDEPIPVQFRCYSDEFLEFETYFTSTPKTCLIDDKPSGQAVFLNDGVILVRVDYDVLSITVDDKTGAVRVRCIIA